MTQAHPLISLLSTHAPHTEAENNLQFHTHTKSSGDKLKMFVNNSEITDFLIIKPTVHFSRPWL